MTLDEVQLKEPLVREHPPADHVSRRVPALCVRTADRKVERGRRRDANVRVVRAVVRLERCEGRMNRRDGVARRRQAARPYCSAASVARYQLAKL